MGIYKGVRHRDADGSDVAQPRRRSAALTGGLIGLVFATLAGCGASGSTFATTSHSENSQVAVAVKGNLEAATLDVTSGTSAVLVSADRLGAELYRVSSPVDSGIRPVVSRTGGAVRVGQESNGGAIGIAVVDIQLATGVRWSIELDGGASQETVNMRSGSVSALYFGAGVSSASVDLPAPVGTETLTMAGGASRLVIVTPRGPPAQVTVGGGAGLVVFDGVRHTGVAGGSVFTGPGWAAARNRYSIVLTAGVSDVQFSRT